MGGINPSSIMGAGGSGTQNSGPSAELQSLRKDYADSKNIVQKIISDIKNEKERLRIMKKDKGADPQIINGQENKISKLQDEQEEWERERDRLKDEVQNLEQIEKEKADSLKKVQKEEQVAGAAAAIPGYGTAVSAGLSAKAEKDKQDALEKSSRKTGKIVSKEEQIKNDTERMKREANEDFKKSKAHIDKVVDKSNDEISKMTEHYAQKERAERGGFSPGGGGPPNNSPDESGGVSGDSPLLRPPSGKGGRFKKIVRGTGMVIFGAGLLAFRGARWIGRGIGSAASKTSAWAKASVEEASTNSGRRFLIELLFLAVIAVHLLEFFFWDFSAASNSIITQRSAVYLGLSLLAVWAFNTNLLYGLFTFFFVISFVPIFFIPLISKLLIYLAVPDKVLTVFGTVILLLPYWLLYLRFYLEIDFPSKGKSPIGRFFRALFTPSKWVKTYFAALAIFFIWWLMTTLIIPGASFAGGQDAALGGSAKESAKGAVTFVKTGYDSLIEAVKGIGKDIKGGVDTWQNDTTSAYYTGQVEQNKERTGIFIEEFEADGKHYDSMQFVAYGYVKVRSFVEGVNITTSCYAQNISNKSQIIMGETDPPELTNIYIEDQRGVICRFGEPGTSNALPAGKYYVVLVLDFRFQTWAYKPYYFLDRTYYVYLRSGGEDPNAKLLIPPRSKTIYTNGPVMIGMDDTLEMPFTISSENTNYLPLGMTVDDKQSTTGSRGQVLRVYNYTLHLPGYFQVQTCTTKVPTPTNDNNALGYKIYTFSNDNDLQLNGSFMTLNCNVIIDKDDVSKIIPVENTPAIVSIVGTTEYDYRLSRQLAVTIEKAPGTT
ncbi:MAG: hypothetical protein ACP5N3_05445 [Candidatus Nanoarchaeia archaeon]